MTTTTTQKELFENNIPLAIYFASRRMKSHEFSTRWGLLGKDFDDAKQVALIALWRASQEFDESLGNQFSTFASTCIKNALWNAAYRTHSPHHIPSTVLPDVPVKPDTNYDNVDQLDRIKRVLSDVLCSTIVGTLEGKPKTEITGCDKVRVAVARYDARMKQIQRVVRIQGIKSHLGGDE